MPHCRLFLVTPTHGRPDHLADALAAAIDVGDVASVLISRRSDRKDMTEVMRKLRQAADAGNVACLVEEDVDLALELGCHGVAVGEPAANVSAARRRLGDDAIVGAHVSGWRHAAMEMGEAGADYVAFAGDDDLLAWWAQLFEVPTVALDGADAARARTLVGLGADFIRPQDAMWRSPQAARRVVAEVTAAIAEAEPAAS